MRPAWQEARLTADNLRAHRTLISSFDLRINIIKMEYMDMSLRQRVEVAVVRLLLERAQVAGFVPHRVDDGDENELVETTTVDQVLCEVLNRDICNIFFTHPSHPKHHYWVKIVLGNDGDDCICDYSTDGAEFDKMMEEVCAISEYRVISLARCPGAQPAWDGGPSNRGPCIRCGEHHSP
jgi:hypothetical protein